MNIIDIKSKYLIINQTYNDFALYTEQLNPDTDDLVDYVINQTDVFYWISIESVWGKIGFVWDELNSHGHFITSQIPFRYIPSIPDAYRIKNIGGMFDIFENINNIDERIVLLESDFINLESINYYLPEASTKIELRLGNNTKINGNIIPHNKISATYPQYINIHGNLNNSIFGYRNHKYNIYYANDLILGDGSFTIYCNNENEYKIENIIKDANVLDNGYKYKSVNVRINSDTDDVIDINLKYNNKIKYSINKNNNITVNINILCNIGDNINTNFLYLNTYGSRNNNKPINVNYNQNINDIKTTIWNPHRHLQLNKDTVDFQNLYFDGLPIENFGIDNYDVEDFYNYGNQGFVGGCINSYSIIEDIGFYGKNKLIINSISKINIIPIIIAAYQSSTCILVEYNNVKNLICAENVYGTSSITPILINNSINNFYNYIIKEVVFNTEDEYYINGYLITINLSYIVCIGSDETSINNYFNRHFIKLNPKLETNYCYYEISVGHFYYTIEDFNDKFRYNNRDLSINDYPNAIDYTLLEDNYENLKNNYIDISTPQYSCFCNASAIYINSYNYKNIKHIFNINTIYFIEEFVTTDIVDYIIELLNNIEVGNNFKGTFVINLNNYNIISNSYDFNELINLGYTINIRN